MWAIRVLNKSLPISWYQNALEVHTYFITVKNRQVLIFINNSIGVVKFGWQCRVDTSIYWKISKREIDFQAIHWRYIQFSFCTWILNFVCSISNTSYGWNWIIFFLLMNWSMHHSSLVLSWFVLGSNPTSTFRIIKQYSFWHFLDDKWTGLFEGQADLPFW